MTSIHQTTFDSLKELLLDSETLAYFDVKAETEKSTDASKVGLGAHAEAERWNLETNNLCKSSTITS